MNKISIILILTFAWCYQVKGQDTTAIATENIQVIRNYEAIIQQAKRKKIEANISQEKLPPINYSYNVTSNVSLDFDRPEPVIRPKTIKLDEKSNQEIKDGRIYGGYGNLSTLKFGGAYHYYIEDWVEAGLKFDHMSASDKSIDFQKFGNTEGELYLGYFLNATTKASLEFRGGNSKHYSPMGNLIDSSLQHNFNNQGATFGLSHNSFEKTGLSIRSKFSYDRIKQTVDSVSQNRLNADLNLLKRINDEFAFEIPFRYSTYNFESTIDSSFSDIVLSPFVRYYGKQFNLNVGAELVFAGDDKYIFPVIRFEMDNVYEEIDLSVFTESEYQRNDLFYLSNLVPYYQTLSTPLVPNYLRTFNLKLSRQFGIVKPSLQFGYNKYTNEAQVFESVSSIRQIAGTVSRNEFSVMPSINLDTEKANLELGFRYNVFLNGNKEDYTYTPSFEINLSASEKLIDKKLTLTQNIAFKSSRSLRTQFAVPFELSPLKSFLDVSLGLDFKINKTFSIFAQGTNLLANEYSIWNNHPVFERQFWGGIKVDL